MKYLLKWSLKLFRAFFIVAFTIIFVWALDARQMPDLEPWHRAELSAEFYAKDHPEKISFEQYLSIERKLFDTVDQKVCRQINDVGHHLLNRYAQSSTMNPNRFKPNWNRTFELLAPKPKGGVLLLHGLSDSPYSLRRVGEIFNRQGFYILGLRLPGHGTIPAELQKISTEDWLAAIQIGAEHVRQTIGNDQPFYLAGYSNGGTLAVKYTLDILEGKRGAMPDRLVLFSPSIGITPFAYMANWHKLLSFIPYFEKSKWTAIEPEYDPYKYNSFPKHAGYLSHRLTTSLQKQIVRLKKNGRLIKLPPILSFQSLVDSTVSTRAVVDALYRHLEAADSELVLFDVNRLAWLKSLIKKGPDLLLDEITRADRLPFTFTWITNLAEDSVKLIEKRKAPMSVDVTSSALNLEWPSGVYSLSHVAVPFSPDDEIYGARATAKPVNILQLGAIAPRGERNLLRVSMSQLMRLRYNPFFEYIEDRLKRLAEAEKER